MGLYYGNVWESQNFPFMSQLLYDGSSNSTNFVTYNLTQILTPEHTINSTAVEAAGVPHMTATYIAYLITTNMGITAALVHMLLWNYDVRQVSLTNSLSQLLVPLANNDWTGLGHQRWMVLPRASQPQESPRPVILAILGSSGVAGGLPETSPGRPGQRSSLQVRLSLLRLATRY
jgi:hypothetical protein